MRGLTPCSCPHAKRSAPLQELVVPRLRGVPGMCHLPGYRHCRSFTSGFVRMVKVVPSWGATPSRGRLLDFMESCSALHDARFPAFLRLLGPAPDGNFVPPPERPIPESHVPLEVRLLSIPGRSESWKCHHLCPVQVSQTAASHHSSVAS